MGKHLAQAVLASLSAAEHFKGLCLRANAYLTEVCNRQARHLRISRVRHLARDHELAKPYTAGYFAHSALALLLTAFVMSEWCVTGSWARTVCNAESYIPQATLNG